MAVAEYGSDDARSLEAMRGIVFSDRKLGDFVRARELQTALIAIARQSSKVTRRDLLAMEMTGLELLYAAGRFAEAVATSVPLVESCDRHLGPDNDVCRRAFVKGAQSLLRLRHVDEVHGQLARVDAIAEDPTAPFLQFEAAILGYRVKMARGMDLGKSRPAVVRFADGEAGSGMSAPFKASALATLAETAIRLGQLDAGSEMLDRTGTILEPTNGRPTQVTAHLKSLRAMIAAKAGAPETALRWLQDAHGELGAVIGLRHPQTAICALNIAIVQHQMGMRVQARAGWDAAAPILREALGADSPAYARILELKHWIDSGDPRVTFEFFT